MEYQKWTYELVPFSFRVEKECRSRKARFITIRERVTNKLAAYLEMKLILDDDDDSLVLYMYGWCVFLIIYSYSIQVDKEFQSRGLGLCLMSFAYDFAKYCKLEKCRLTVFKVKRSFSFSFTV